MSNYFDHLLFVGVGCPSCQATSSTEENNTENPSRAWPYSVFICLLLDFYTSSENYLNYMRNILVTCPKRKDIVIDENKIIFMAALRSRCGHYIFALWFLLFLSFSSPNLSRRRLDVYHTFMVWSKCEFRMQV